MKPVDFKNSYIEWKTYTGSYGLFSPEAYLKHEGVEWLLGASVMACNVYGKEDLFKKPPYSFQPLFSKKSCVVFRTYEQEYKVDDTVSKPSDQFINHKVCINYLPDHRERILNEAEPKKNHQCIINFENVNVQFPVKHFNIDHANNIFQIETGPVALPYEGNICTAYLAFNKLTEFEALVMISKNNKRISKTITQKNCDIKIISEV